MRDDPRTTSGRGCGRRHTAQVAALSGLALTAVLLLPAPARATAPAAPPDRPTAEVTAGAPGGGRTAMTAVAAPVLVTADEVTKFYVVKSPRENGGEADALPGIAARLLGTPDRVQEILVLNTGRLLPGGEVFVSADQVVPGFALRLPTDAQGPDVQVGPLPEETPGEEQQEPAGPGAPATGRPTGAFGGPEVPMPLLIGGIVAVVLLTVSILARRPLARWARALGRGVAGAARVLRPRLPRPLALVLLRRRRAALARRLAADSRTPVRVRSALAELVRAGGPGSPPRVYSVRAGDEELLASVSGAFAAPEHWTALEANAWRREGLPSALGHGAGGDKAPREAAGTAGAPAGSVLTLPHLARVGVDERGAQVMVGLGQINGALSVGGDQRVAQDTVTALAHGLLELPWQNTVVVVLDPDGDVLPGLHGVVRVRSLAEVAAREPVQVFEVARRLGLGLVRAPEGPDRITGFVLVPRPPDRAEARALAGLAAPRGRWTVLAAGDVPGAHWRWYAAPEGTVDLGVLGLTVIVPTPLKVG
ncbi:hypothetical protein [Streptomyces sp. NPDC088789]|uniref:hypothetical protein n=1 Tax=Streptomyces sp. NPDC088789 TaxID=3365899 RepID=UPI00380592A6